MENKFLSSLAFWKILVLILFIACVALGAMVYQKQIAGVPSTNNNNTQNNTEDIGAQTAADRAMKYINQYLISDGSGVFKSVSEEKLTYYKFTFDYNGNEWSSYVSADGKNIIPSGSYDIPELVEKEVNTVDASFKEIVGAEICKENDKPIVYFFGSSTCPHCEWEKPLIQEVVGKFGDAISYHENIDSQNDQDIFNEYSTGGVPTVVIGCKYYRVGSGESGGEETEKQALTKFICDITGNQADVCK